MGSSIASGLARVTVATPTRRVDVALPEHVPAAELLPSLLRHAGDDLADIGEEHGGWILRRIDGAMVDPTQTLAAQAVHDGEVLHLAPRQDEWPEIDYDDVVDAVASEARRQVRTWSSAATRRTAITLTVVSGLAALALALSSGPPWTKAAAVMLVVSGVLALMATGLARSFRDTGAGAAVGGVAMSLGFAGGLTMFNGSRTILQVHAQQLLAGSAVLIVAAIVCYVGVADQTQFFVCGAHVGLFGVLAAVVGLDHHLSRSDVAAIVVATAVALLPAMPLLSIRLGKLPVPALPATAEELLADKPKVPAQRVYATVRRTDELLTGMLAGNSAVAAICMTVLAINRRHTALLLVGLVAACVLLQARLFPTLRHRVPLIGSGVWGVLNLVAESASRSVDFRIFFVVPLLVIAAGLVLGAGRLYENHPPGPYMGRIADILDVLMVIAVVPVTCVLVGLVGYARHLYH